LSSLVGPFPAHAGINPNRSLCFINNIPDLVIADGLVFYRDAFFYRDGTHLGYLSAGVGPAKFASQIFRKIQPELRIGFIVVPFQHAY
jgi:hypothetical protein